MEDELAQESDGTDELESVEVKMEDLTVGDVPGGGESMEVDQVPDRPAPEPSVPSGESGMRSGRTLRSVAAGPSSSHAPAAPTDSRMGEPVVRVTFTYIMITTNLVTGKSLQYVSP